MSRKRFTTNEMLQLSADWTNPDSDAHKAILASTDLAPSLPRIKTVHIDLASAAQPTALNPRLFEIIKEQTDLDDRHDDIIRGVYGFLTATAALLDNQDRVALITLRDLLIPDGLSSVQKSYLDEAGQATQLEPRLTPEIRAQLKKINVGPKNKNHTLNEFIDEWIQLGKQLGTLEKEKALLAPTQSDSPSTGMNLVAARNKWLRAVNLFIAIAEAAELDPKTDHIIFSSLRAAEAKSARRGRSTTPNEDPQAEESTEEPHKP
jgi:hypothetical protein